MSLRFLFALLLSASSVATSDADQSAAPSWMALPLEHVLLKAQSDVVGGGGGLRRVQSSEACSTEQDALESCITSTCATCLNTEYNAIFNDYNSVTCRLLRNEVCDLVTNGCTACANCRDEARTYYGCRYEFLGCTEFDCTPDECAAETRAYGDCDSDCIDCVSAANQAVFGESQTVSCDIYEDGMCSAIYADCTTCNTCVQAAENFWECLSSCAPFLACSQATNPPTAAPQAATPTTTSAPQAPSPPAPNPTSRPSRPPTFRPTLSPSANPTAQPTTKPTQEPTGEPTAVPTAVPTADPTSQSTSVPTFQPTVSPAGTQGTQGGTPNTTPQPPTTDGTDTSGEGGDGTSQNGGDRGIDGSEQSQFQQDNDDGDDNKGMLMGVLVGAIVALVLVAAAMVYYALRSRDDAGPKNNHGVDELTKPPQSIAMGSTGTPVGAPMFFRDEHGNVFPMPSTTLQQQHPPPQFVGGPPPPPLPTLDPTEDPSDAHEPDVFVAPAAPPSPYRVSSLPPQQQQPLAAPERLEATRSYDL